MDDQFVSIFATGHSPEETLPDDALAVLPLSEEPLTLLSPESDLHTYLSKLLAGTGFDDVVDIKFAGVVEHALNLAAYFQEAADAACPAPGSKTQEPHIPDFESDPLFGRVAKAYIAWEETMSNIMEEGGYFSLSHTLETRSDLACSLQLARDMYYRQAMQVMRGFIESVILPIHFCRNPDHFSKWKRNDFNSPTMRGEKGILEGLAKHGVIPEKLKEDISSSYKLLNSYIHGSEEALNNAGVSRGAWEGHVFQKSRFAAWAEVFISLIEVSLQLVKINLVQWGTAKAERDLFCTVCHGVELEEIQSSDDAGLTQYRCVQCTHSFWQDGEGNRAVFTTASFEG